VCAPVCAPASLDYLDLKVARTVVASTSFVTQPREPWQPPDQDENLQPLAGCGIRLTRASVGKCAEHFFGHLMAVGLLVTVPFPETVTLSVGSLGVDRAGSAAQKASDEPTRMTTTRRLATDKTLAPFCVNRDTEAFTRGGRWFDPSRAHSRLARRADFA